MAKTTHRRPAQRKAPRYDAVARACKVMAACAVLLLASTVAAFFIVWDVAKPQKGYDLGSIVQESGYDATKNTIDQGEFSATVLPETEDAGQEYIDTTLFLGDSNTARMYRMFDYCSYDNAIGSVGMSARSLQKYACVKFSGYGSYVTMPQAVALMQPRRVIVTFGTNDLDPDYSAASFAESYRAGLQAIADAYPAADIIVNAIPPLGRSHSNASLTQSQVDEYNKAIVEMCDANGWKFLNSAEVLKDAATGYAKEGYVESSASGMLVGIETAARLLGMEPVDFPQETAIGALGLYVSNESVTVFQPMNINFGIIPPLDHRVKGKRNKNAELSARSLAIIDRLKEEVCQ